MNSYKKIAYIGFSLEMIEYLLKSPFFKCEVVFCDKERITEEYFSLCTKNKIKLVLVKNDREIKNWMDCSKEFVDFFIIFKTAIIIHSPLLTQYSFFNIHPGSLFNNKGAHPLIWTILKGDSSAFLCLHKINEKIDEGILIKSICIAVSTKDTPITIEQKLILHIPFLLIALNEYIHHKITGSLVLSGGYRRKICEKDYTIDLVKDTIEIISQKIRSQASYKGAVLIEKNKKLYVKDFFTSYPENYDTYRYKLIEVKCKNGKLFLSID